MLFSCICSYNIDQCFTSAGGAGGKGTWGKLGSEVLDEDIMAEVLDPNDPNYDDQNPEDVRLKVTTLQTAANGYKKAKDNLTDEEICVSSRWFLNKGTQ